MSAEPGPAHLSNHHRTTLRQIFQHPVSHNIEWRSVLSLLAAVGSVTEHADGKVAATVGSETMFFDPSVHKDVDTQAVIDLRRLTGQRRPRSRGGGGRRRRRGRLAPRPARGRRQLGQQPADRLIGPGQPSAATARVAPTGTASVPE